MNRIALLVALTTTAAQAPPDITYRYDVIVNLEPGVPPGEPELAAKVRHELLDARPENIRRDQSFYTMRTTGGLAVVRTGWWLQIRRVVPTKGGGWRALVYVSPTLMVAENKRFFSTGNFHIEAYASKGGRLTLEGDMVNPLDDPADGLAGAIVGGPSK